uniref:Uncharacterized protein n=1 Tax=Arundo donax TaxID=35708 RepID=A0A0A8YLM3_ARUDO
MLAALRVLPMPPSMPTAPRPPPHPRSSGSSSPWRNPRSGEPAVKIRRRKKGVDGKSRALGWRFEGNRRQSGSEQELGHWKLRRHKEEDRCGRGKNAEGLRAPFIGTEWTIVPNSNGENLTVGVACTINDDVILEFRV